MTLSELLARRELGLRLLGGGDDPQAVRIQSAEVCDLPDPRSWLGPGVMLLTTGVAIGTGAHRQQLLVERAVEVQVSAVGFAVGLVHPAVPRGIVEACERLQMPLVAVPAATPFRLIVAAVADQSVPQELQTAQRTLGVQSHLMEALSAADPEAEVLRRLGALLTGTALIADEAGSVTGAPDTAVPDELWGLLRGGKGVGMHHLRGRRYVTAAISDRVGTRRWIVVAGPDVALPDSLARQAVLSAERLVRLIDRARPPRAVEARPIRSELAEELLGWRLPTGGRRQLTHRASALGLDVDAAMHVVTMRLRGSRELTREAVAQSLARVQVEVEAHLTEHAVAFLMTVREDDLVAIGDRGLAEQLEETLHELVGSDELNVGVGRMVTQREGLVRSYSDARFALDQLDAVPPTGQRVALLRYDDLDLVTVLVCDADPAVLGPRRQAILDALGGAPLEETLRVYLLHRLDVSSTSAALHLHPNSLRYRLSRIEDRLGRSLRDPGTIAMLHIVFRYDWALPGR